ALAFAPPLNPHCLRTTALAHPFGCGQVIRCPNGGDDAALPCIVLPLVGAEQRFQLRHRLADRHELDAVTSRQSPKIIHDCELAERHAEFIEDEQRSHRSRFLMLVQCRRHQQPCPTPFMRAISKKAAGHSYSITSFLCASSFSSS